MCAFAAGDVFALQLSAGDWVTCRVLLDVRPVFRAGLVGKHSPLRFNGAVTLVEIYDEVSSEPADRGSDPLAPSMWVTSAELDAVPMIGNRRVDPRAVDFPERAGLHRTSSLSFAKGEVEREVRAKTKRELVPFSELYYTLGDQGLSRMVGVAELRLGRTEHARDDNSALFSITHDLRVHPLRSDVLRYMKIDPATSYFDLANDAGHIPARFWAL
jgi:hypothetical protein